MKENKGESMNAADSAYRVYIVRCWDEGGEAPTGNASRFVLEIPRTNERYGFTSADNLLRALHAQLDYAPIAPPANPVLEMESNGMSE
jgi:hypothetical protein